MNSGETLVLLTNNTVLATLSICAIYKSRWLVGLLTNASSRISVSSDS